MRKMGIVMLLATATPALAVDLFTLVVPVQVSHLHPTITQIEVRCNLNGRDPATGAATNYGPGGGKWQRFPVTGGAASATANIIFRTEDFTPAQLTNLASVNSGDCHLTLYTVDMAYQPYASSTGPAVAHAPGTPFNSQSNFTIH